jgi:hypothetical protein
MKAMKNKIDINDLRLDKGGDPDIYRRALSMHVDNEDSSSPQPHGQSSSSLVSSQASPTDYIDEAVSHDTRRRVALTSIEELRSKLSNLQKTVITPKMKAKEEVTSDILQQAKQWKCEITNLTTEMNDAEKNRDDVLDKINNMLAKIENLSNVVDSTLATTNNTTSATTTASKEERMDNGRESSSNGAGIISPGTQQQQPPPKIHPKLSIFAPEFSPKTLISHTTTMKQPMNNGSSSSSSLSSTSSSTTTTTTTTNNHLPILSSPEQIKSIPPERILNVNVGVLGHVDTGKTSLVINIYIFCVCG